MTVVCGISMVKDEADIVEATVANMVTKCDFVIVADNGSTDGTRDILDGLAADYSTLTIVDDPEPGYYQSQKMSALAETAMEKGATWVVPFDADEYWMSQWGTFTDVLRGLAPDFGLVRAELFDHVATGIDPDLENPIRRMKWRRPTPLPLPKVACRTAPGLVIEQGNHYARYPVPARATDGAVFTVHHYPYRSVEQLIRKVRNGAAAYAASALPEDMGSHWRQWGRMSDEQIGELFYKWYWRDDPRVPIEIEGECQPALIRQSL